MCDRVTPVVADYNFDEEDVDCTLGIARRATEFAVKELTGASDSLFTTFP